MNAIAFARIAFSASGLPQSCPFVGSRPMAHVMPRKALPMALMICNSCAVKSGCAWATMLGIWTFMRGIVAAPCDGFKLNTCEAR